MPLPLEHPDRHVTRPYWVRCLAMLSEKQLGAEELLVVESTSYRVKRSELETVVDEPEVDDQVVAKMVRVQAWGRPRMMEPVFERKDGSHYQMMLDIDDEDPLPADLRTVEGVVYPLETGESDG